MRRSVVALLFVFGDRREVAGRGLVTRSAAATPLFVAWRSGVASRRARHGAELRRDGDLGLEEFDPWVGVWEADDLLVPDSEPRDGLLVLHLPEEA